MSVRQGRELLSIPGPSVVPDAVLAAMHCPSIEIYGGALAELTASCLADLRRVFETRDAVYIYVANGHGAWEAALSNVLSRGDTVLVLDSGRFAAGWGEMASALGVEVETLVADPRGAVDPGAVEAHLRADRAGRIKAVLVVQIDTASGVVNDLAAIRCAIDASAHPALLMVDAVASLGIVPLGTEANGIDVAVAASQKGLMCPPGLSFVAAGPKARAAHQKAGLRTRYWDWTDREGPAHYHKYCGTPPVQQLFALRKALDMLLEEGLDHVFARHQILASAVRAAVDAWSADGGPCCNVIEPAARSNAVTTVLTPFDPAPLREYCDARLGVVLGLGIGAYRDRSFRIAHMGHLNAPMILGTLGAIEVALAGLGLPHGRGGVSAAIASLSTALAS